MTKQIRKDLEANRSLQSAEYILNQPNDMYVLDNHHITSLDRFLAISTNATMLDDNFSNWTIAYFLELQSMRNNHIARQQQITRQQQSEQVPRPINKNVITNILSGYYSVSELKSMCFDIGIDYYDLDGTSKSDKARELVVFADRRNRLSEVIDYIKNTRPEVNLS